MRSIQKLCLAWLFIFISMLVYSSLAEAEMMAPEPLNGAFVFVDTFEPVMTIDVKRVYGFTEAGRAEVSALKSEGYSCQFLPRQTYRCRKHLETKEVTSEIGDRVFSKIEDHTWVDFLDVKGGVEELVNNDSYKAWRVSRGVSTPLGFYRSYEITWTPNVSKVILRDEKGDLPTLYFNMGDLNALNIQTSVSKTLGRDNFQIHIVRAMYERGCYVGGSLRSSSDCGDRDIRR